VKNLIKKILKEEYYESRKSVDGYVDAEELLGERVWVHTNRTHRNNGWNGMIGIYYTNSKGKKTGSPIAYTNEIRLQGPIVFQTSESGAERIQKSGSRTLIAGVSGYVIDTEGSLGGYEEITYNPFDKGHEYFVRVGDLEKKEIVSTGELYFISTEDGEYKIYAKDIEYSEIDMFMNRRTPHE
jgi:hypothetical protein